MLRLIPTLFLLLPASAFAQGGPPPGYDWVEHPSNGHYYAITGSQTWEEALLESEQLGLGGSLATIRNLDENAWLTATFNPTSGTNGFWCGLFQDANDPSYSEPSGGWKWVSGEATPWWAANGEIGNGGVPGNWSDSEPNDSQQDEHFCIVDNSDGEWNDWRSNSGSKTNALLEWDPAGADGWYGNPDNGHWYRLTNTVGSWDDCEAEAVSYGGHLATIGDMAEADWLEARFFSVYCSDNASDFGPWIGLYQDLNDPNFWEPSGGWKWASGESFDPSVFKDWSAGEPNNSGNSEHWAHLVQKNDAVGWNDYDLTNMLCGLPGIIECPFSPYDSDRDGLADDIEIARGSDPWDQDTDDDGLGDGEETFESADWVLNPATGHVYAIAPDSGTWAAARNFADLVDGELVTINNGSENAWVAEVMGSLSISWGWIGITDEQVEGNWKWLSGSGSSYRNWDNEQPSADTPSEIYDGGVIHCRQSPYPLGVWHAGRTGGTAGAWGHGQAHAIIERDFYPTSALAFDSDGDGLSDGQEKGRDTIIWDGDFDGDGVADVAGTDPTIFVPDADPATVTNPSDQDSDDDGFLDGEEDTDLNGAATGFETDAAVFDTDNDGLSDGLESGLTQSISLDTNLSIFVPDIDPSTTTDPLNPDTDGGGAADGAEDWISDGLFMEGMETDPNNPSDDLIDLEVSNLHPRVSASIVVTDARAGALIYAGYSLAGPGPFMTNLGFDVALTPPINIIGSQFADATTGSASWQIDVPARAPVGLGVYFQAVESAFFGLTYRTSNPVTKVVQ